MVFWTPLFDSRWIMTTGARAGSLAYVIFTNPVSVQRLDVVSGMRMNDEGNTVESDDILNMIHAIGFGGKVLAVLHLPRHIGKVAGFVDEVFRVVTGSGVAANHIAPPRT